MGQGGSTLVMGQSRKLLASFTSTLGVGSTFVVSSAIDITQVKAMAGIAHVESSNVVIQLQQSLVNSPWDITSTQGVAVGNETLDFTAYGKWAELSITTVISAAAGDVLRVHLHGVPI